MKTSIAVTLMALASFGAASTASAYSLSPPDTAARLRGSLTFTPDEGSGIQPFKCKVTLHLQTKGLIKAITMDDSAPVCKGVGFLGLPWEVVVTGANSGVIGTVRFGSSDGDCIQGGNAFQDNASGVWTLAPGPCLSGTLTSTPPITIVP
jgi:hypothetical protein